VRGTGILKVDMGIANGLFTVNGVTGFAVEPGRDDATAGDGVTILSLLAVELNGALATGAFVLAALEAVGLAKVEGTSCGKSRGEFLSLSGLAL